MAKKKTKRKVNKKKDNALLTLIGLDIIILLAILIEMAVFGL